MASDKFEEVAAELGNVFVGTRKIHPYVIEHVVSLLRKHFVPMSDALLCARLIEHLFDKHKGISHSKLSDACRSAACRIIEQAGVGE